MTDINEYIEAEFENIERLLGELPTDDSLENLSGLELSGTAAILHGFYNGIENLLKQVVRHRGGQIPQGPSWHRDLMALAVANHIISAATAEALKGYMAFRHFFGHAYTFDLDKERILPLIRSVSEVLLHLRRDLDKSLLSEE